MPVYRGHGVYRIHLALKSVLGNVFQHCIPQFVRLPGCPEYGYRFGITCLTPRLSLTILDSPSGNTKVLPSCGWIKTPGYYIILCFTRTLINYGTVSDYGGINPQKVTVGKANPSRILKG